MRSTFRTLPVSVLACLFLVTFAAPVSSLAQASAQDQAPHPITSLPLPPDEVEKAPAAPKQPTPTPAVVPEPKGKPSARHGRTPTVPSAPAPTTVIVPAASAPGKTATPSLVVVTPETPATKTRSGKRGKNAPVEPAPATDTGSPHAITGLPLPPDEEPTTPVRTPAPARTTTLPAIAPTNTPAPTTKTPPAKTAAPKTTAPTTPAPTRAAPVKIEPIVPVTPPPPVTLPETPEPKTSAPAPVAPPPAAVKPQPVVPKITPKVVVPPPTPTLKPRNPATDANKPSTVILPSGTSSTGRPAEPTKPSVSPSGTVSTVAPSPVPKGTLGAIVFQGADPFTADELTPIAGLNLGTTPSEEDLGKASQNLIDTGYFYNVSATFAAVANVGTATFVLQPAASAQLRRLSFANFVWFTPAEIEDILKRVPLYHGYGSVPATNNGPLVSSIQAALSRALMAKGVPAMITHSDVPPNVLHPYASIEFRVTEPGVVLESASLFDIPPSLVTKTLKAQELAVKQPYNEGIAGTTLTDLLLRPARDAGFIGAKLWRIDRKRRPMGNNVGVTFTARMDAGQLYTVRSLGWVPTPVFSSTDFHRNTGLMPGKPPTPAGLEKTQQAILTAYHSQGYVDAQVLVNSDLDAKTGAANYTFSVNPGPQYILRTITIQGLPADAQRDFEAAWTNKPGDVYNEDYLLNFINNHPDIKSLKPYTFDYNRSATTDTHMIDLVITFRPVK